MHAPDYYQNLDLEGKNDILVICLNVHKKTFSLSFLQTKFSDKEIL